MVKPKQQGNGVLIMFQRILSRLLSFDAPPHQRQHLVKGDVLSNQPLCIGCTASTVGLMQMNVVWPGPCHLYFVTLTASAAVLPAFDFPLSLSTIRPTGTMLDERLLLV